jgi:hypothetical protein
MNLCAMLEASEWGARRFRRGEIARKGANKGLTPAGGDTAVRVARGAGLKIRRSVGDNGKLSVGSSRFSAFTAAFIPSGYGFLTGFPEVGAANRLEDPAGSGVNEAL